MPSDMYIWHLKYVCIKQGKSGLGLFLYQSKVQLLFL